jgi:hypothetical protein
MTNSFVLLQKFPLLEIQMLDTLKQYWLRPFLAGFMLQTCKAGNL